MKIGEVKDIKKVVIIGSIILASLIGLSFINYRKKKIALVSKMFEGIEEVGNNRGFADSTFEDMMRNVGWKDGEAWCSYFAKLVYIKALPSLEQDINKWFSGSSQLTYQNVANGKSDYFEIVQDGKPKKGDVVIWQNIGDSSKGHVGIVVKTYLGNPYKFDAIEGNTNFQPDFSGQGQLVDIVPHETKVNESDSVYQSKILKGFIRLK